MMLIVPAEAKASLCSSTVRPALVPTASLGAVNLVVFGTADSVYAKNGLSLPRGWAIPQAVSGGLGIAGGIATTALSAFAGGCVGPTVIGAGSILLGTLAVILAVRALATSQRTQTANHPREERIRVSLSGGVQSSLVEGMGVSPLFRFAYGIRFWRLEIGIRTGYATGHFVARSPLPHSQTVPDAEVTNHIMPSAITFAYEGRLNRLIFRGYIVGEVQLWSQEASTWGNRIRGVVGAGVGAGMRVLMYRNLFTEVAVEGMLYFTRPDPGGPTPFTALNATLGFGVML